MILFPIQSSIVLTLLVFQALCTSNRMRGQSGNIFSMWLIQTGLSPPSEQPKLEAFFPFANAAYYPNWRIYRQQPPSSLNLEHISHLFYSFLWVDSDATIYFSDEHADLRMNVDGSKGCLNACIALKKHYPHLKVIASVGGGGGPSNAAFSVIAGKAELRDAFASNARILVDKYALDGIDIDWEHPSSAEQGIGYVRLLKAVRKRLPSVSVTSALPAGRWILEYIDIGQASRHLDFINLMAYDFYGPWTNRSGHQAQLFAPENPLSSADTISGNDTVVRLCSMGVPSRKILLGIPVYGRSFTGVDKAGQPYTGHAGEEGTFEYRDLPRSGAQEHVNSQLGAAYCTGGDGGFVTYDNPQTVRAKADYVKEKRLGGLFYWAVTSDAKGPRSLVDAGFNALHYP